jgi:hypothetical protein
MHAAASTAVSYCCKSTLNITMHEISTAVSYHYYLLMTTVTVNVKANGL